MRVIDKKLISPYLAEPYTLNKVKTAVKCFNRSLKLFNKKRVYNLNEGLHSYASLPYAKNREVPSATASIFEAVIPAGARYIEGLYGEIISDKLKVLRRI